MADIEHRNTEMQDAVIKEIVAWFSQLIGKKIINFEVPPKDDSGDILFTMVLRWRKVPGEQKWRPAKGDSITLRINPDGLLVNPEVEVPLLFTIAELHNKHRESRNG